MKATKLTDKELRDAGVCALPSRPTAPKSLGGGGYTPTQMKEAFDRLPLLIADRLNLLIDAANGLGEDSLAGAMPTGIKDGHTLAELMKELKDGGAASYITVFGTALSTYLGDLRYDLDRVMDALGIEREVG